MDKIIINKENILNNIGVEFENTNDYIEYLQNLIDFLETHNKNYNKHQYYKILELKEIINNISIEK